MHTNQTRNLWSDNNYQNTWANRYIQPPIGIHHIRKWKALYQCNNINIFINYGFLNPTTCVHPADRWNKSNLNVHRPYEVKKELHFATSVVLIWILKWRSVCIIQIQTYSTWIQSGTASKAPVHILLCSTVAHCHSTPCDH